MISKEKMNRRVPTAKATKWKKVGMTSVGNIAMWFTIPRQGPETMSKQFKH